MVTRALTLAELIEMGLDEENAKMIIERQETPKPRSFRFVCKITDEMAAQLNEQYPDLKLERAKWTK